MATILYYHPLSTNCRKVRLAAHALGIPLNLRLVDLVKGEHRTPDYLAINPNGKLPTLVEGNTTIWESTAIAIFLASKQETSLWPNGSRRFTVLQWLAWSDSHWSRALEAVVFERLFKAAITGTAPDEATVERGLALINRFAPVLNSALEARPWVAGADTTLADFALVGTLMFADQAQLPIAQYKFIARWLDRIRALDSWTATEPPKSG